MVTAAGIAPRSRPISAAGGAAPVPPDAFEMAWSRLFPSIRSRRVAARGSRSGCGIDAIVRAGEHAATIGRWDCCCWSTSMASSIAARIPSRAWRPSWPTGRRAATTSSTSRTTRCITGPTTSDAARGDGRARLAGHRRVIRAGDGGSISGTTTRTSGGCWSSVVAGSSASCATSATTWSPPGLPPPG